MKGIQNAGVKLGKVIIEIISAQIIRYVTSEEFKDRVEKMLDDTIKLMVKIVLKENETIEKI